MSQSVTRLARSTVEPIEFIDLQAQRRHIGARMEDAIRRVLEHGRYIMGPEVAELERQLAEFCGSRHVLTCANGTDALGLALLAKGAGPGQAIFVPSFTFAATAEVVAWCGATAVFVDVLPETFNIDPRSLKSGIATAERQGLTPGGVIPVDLFGLPADYDEIQPISDKHGMWILCDAAQSFGASYRGRRVGTLGAITTTSFFPAKPLGCYGDGGAVFLDDDDTIAVLRSLRVHGQGTDKYDNVRVGMNARLDTVQAAVLLEKLRVFPQEIEARNHIARRYNEALRGFVTVPELPPGSTSTWAQYTLLLPTAINRELVMQRLKADGVPTAVYYGKPLHLQTAYKHYPMAGNGLPISERLAGSVLSLPMHPYLDELAQKYICDKLVGAIKAAGL